MRIVLLAALVMVLPSAIGCSSGTREAVDASLPASVRAPEIILAHNSPAERAAEQGLRNLLRQYDTSRWQFTDRVVIDETNTIPHSHPVLTLNTVEWQNPPLQLSTYLHENLHWWLEANRAGLAAAMAELAAIYPEVPVGFPRGASSRESTYEHLVNCWLEIEAIREVGGEQWADQMLRYLKGHHYRWVYERVEADHARIGQVVRLHGLVPPGTLLAARR